MISRFPSSILGRVSRLAFVGSILVPVATMLLNGCASSGTSKQTSQKTPVYVADAGRAAVDVFDGDGNYLSQISYSFSSPRSVATDSQGNLYVKNENTTGAGSCAVEKFDSKGNFLLQFGECPVPNGGIGPGIFDNVGLVATDMAGNVWVSSPDFYNIQMFDGSGNFLAMLCLSTITINGATCFMPTPQAEQPTSVAVDGNGNFYVACNPSSSPALNVLLKFDVATGAYLGEIGSPGSGNGQFSSIGGLAVDASNNLYVSDYGNGRVQKLDSSGNYLSQFGSVGNAPGDFAGGPGAIALDAGGNAYVLDPAGYRVLVFDSSGNYLREFGSQGQGPGQFTFPAGIAVGQ